MIDEVIVDSAGKSCPQPIIDIAQVARQMQAGGQIVLISDDPATATDLPAWCRMKGHIFLGVESGAPARYLVQLGGSPQLA